MTTNKIFDVIIIGGSYAGLSAAMSLGRSLRDVLVIDGGSPCNRQTPHSHNFLTQDGKEPKEISTLARQQVERYPTVSFYDGLATAVKKAETGFVIGTGAGNTFASKKLILATGIKDKLPAIKGLSECWGNSVIHCPYCHGYEYRDAKTGIMANGDRNSDRTFHIATLVSNLTNDLTILTSAQVNFTTEQLTKLEQHKIKIVATEISEISHSGGHLENIVFSDGDITRFDAVYAIVPFTQHSEIATLLSCELTEQGYIKVDSFQKTNIPGVYACGDNSSMMRSVASAVATGNLTGAMVNRDLTEEAF